MSTEKYSVGSSDCEECHGEGTVDEPVWDDDSHNWEPTGWRECLCVKRRMEYLKEIDND